MKKDKLGARRNETTENVRKSKRRIVQPSLDRRAKTMLSNYFRRRSDRLEVVSTTRTPKGQIIDWVPIDKQRPGGRIAVPPPVPKLHFESSGKRNESFVKFELELNGAARG